MVNPFLFAVLYLSIILQNRCTADNRNGVAIYVTNGYRRHIVKLMGSGQHIITNTTGNVRGLDYDPVEKKFYWTESHPPAIKRSHINGENVALVADLPANTGSSYLAIDIESRKLFYTGNSIRQLVAMDFTGSNAKIFLDSTSVFHLLQIIIHSKKRQLIWTEYDISSDYRRIRTSSYDGSNIRTIVNMSSESNGLAVDEENDILYWSEHDTGLIQSVSLDGSNRRVIYRHGTYGLLGLFLLDTTLYFTINRGHVYRVPVEGGNAEVLSLSSFFQPFGLYVLPDNNGVCNSGLYGTGCTLPCSERKCLDSDSVCNRVTGQCVGGCQAGYSGTDCVGKCEPGFYGSGCSFTCSERKCVDDTSVCNHVTGQCIGGCKPGYLGTDCSQKCDIGLYGFDCTLKCRKRKCRYISSRCDHETGQCEYGCQAGYSGTDCIQPCSPGVSYGVNCEKACNARHCVGSSTECDPQTGQCPDGCEPNWGGTDCANQCSSGTFGSDCTSCSRRRCQGESDCPADGACSQGCLDGYIGQTCIENCASGYYGSGCNLSCTDRNCLRDFSQCFHMTGQCVGGCMPGYKAIDCSQRCESGSYGYGCRLNCTDRNCLNFTSGCDHVTGRCIGGCQTGYNGTDCKRRCSFGNTYGVNCEKSCSARHCVRSSTSHTCFPETGQCLDGCEPKWGGVDCATLCPAGTFGSDCTSCSTRHCQGESDCPADGTCSQGCQQGYTGHACMQTETKSSLLVVVAGAVVGAILVIVLVVLWCLYRQNKLPCMKPDPVSGDSTKMDKIR